jgi:NTP pyrophosphatase (non-canonical NTP hydrolase)
MPAPKQQAVTIEELNQTIWNHMEARDWHKSAPRGVAISIALEANELLEHYQWQDQPVGGTEAVGEELADIFIYGIQFAQLNNIDLVDHIKRKLEKAAKKYPAENFKGKTGDEMQQAWLKDKLAHQKKGL